MKNEDYDLDKMKADVSLLNEAAAFFVGMHNPGQNLETEPYATLVRKTSNDFLRMEAKGGFKITRLSMAEQIEMVNDLIVYASKRVRELIHANHDVPSTLEEYPSKVDFSGGAIELYFDQVHRYAEETYCGSITPEQLEMTNDQWNAHVESVRIKRLQKKSEDAERKKKEEREKDLKQFNYLKDKLGQ